MFEPQTEIIGPGLHLRKLESDLIRLGTAASLNGGQGGILVSQPAKPSVFHGDGQIAIERIQDAVSKSFGLRPDQLREKTRTKTISYARQIAMYLAREFASASLPRIGRAFGGKDHTTVLRAVRKIEDLRRTSSDVNRLIQRLIDAFHLTCGRSGRAA